MNRSCSLLLSLLGGFCGGNFAQYLTADRTCSEAAASGKNYIRAEIHSR